MRDQLLRLKNTGCFPSLDDNTLLTLVRSGTFRELRRERAVFYQGDLATALYLVLEGGVRKIQYRSNDTSFLLGKTETGGWLGLAEMVNSGPYCYDAISETAVILFCLDSNTFKNLISISTFARDLLKPMAGEIYRLHACMDLDSPVEKILGYLTGRTNTRNGDIHITQEQLAEAVGYTRETVNRHLQILQQQGIVRLSRGIIRIMLT